MKEKFDSGFERLEATTLVFEVGKKLFEFDWRSFAKWAKEEKGLAEDQIEMARSHLESARIQLKVLYSREAYVEDISQMAKELCGFIDQCQGLGKKERNVMFKAEEIEQFITKLSFLES